MCKLTKFKPIVISFISVFLFMGVFQAGFAATLAPTIQPINRMVAIVNNEAITEDQLNTKMRLVTQQLKAAKQSIPPKNILRQQLLQQMINEKLQLQFAKRSGIRASQSEITSAVNRIAKQNKKTLKEMYQSIEQQGWTIKAFKQEMRTEIIIQKLQGRDVASRINISQQELNDFIQVNFPPGKTTMPEYHLAVITISLPSTPSSQDVTNAKDRASKIVAQLNKGANFSKLAATKSTGTSVLNGGDLGWKKLAALPREYSKFVPTLKVGQVSDPIRTANGFDIIKVLSKRQSDIASSSRRKEAQELLFQRQFAEELQTFLGRLRSAAYIKILL